jgi:hypothetical protein
MIAKFLMKKMLSPSASLFHPLPTAAASAVDLKLFEKRIAIQQHILPQAEAKYRQGGQLRDAREALASLRKNTFGSMQSDIPEPNSDKHNNPLTRQSENEQTAGIFMRPNKTGRTSTKTRKAQNTK